MADLLAAGKQVVLLRRCRRRRTGRTPAGRRRHHAGVTPRQTRLRHGPCRPRTVIGVGDGVNSASSGPGRVSRLERRRAGQYTQAVSSSLGKSDHLRRGVRPGRIQPAGDPARILVVPRRISSPCPRHRRLRHALASPASAFGESCWWVLTLRIQRLEMVSMESLHRSFPLREVPVFLIAALFWWSVKAAIRRSRRS